MWIENRNKNIDKQLMYNRRWRWDVLFVIDPYLERTMSSISLWSYREYSRRCRYHCPRSLLQDQLANSIYFQCTNTHQRTEKSILSKWMQTLKNSYLSIVLWTLQCTLIGLCRCPIRDLVVDWCTYVRRDPFCDWRRQKTE